MDNNLYNDITERLIAYIDGEMSDENMRETEVMIAAQPALKEQLEQLRAAKEAIASAGNRLSVIKAQKDFENNRKQKAEAPAMVKPMFSLKTFMRVAAIFILIASGFVIYEYSATTASGLYSENYSAYKIPVLRGDKNITDIEDAYQKNDYDKVIFLFNNKQIKNQQDYFIAGLSFLEKNNTKDCINALNMVKQLNTQQQEKAYNYETDYYLAMAWLKAGNADEFENAANVILKDTSHPYYSSIKNIKSWQIQVLKWKTN